MSRGQRLIALKRPIAISNFAVTYRYNGRCSTCGIWRIQDPEHGEMALDEIRLLFDRNREFLREVVSIQITGGEPFMRKDLAEIVLTIRQQLPDYRFWIPTNALDTMRIKETTIKILRGLDGGGLGISVSIDGLRETHDRIRGVRGAFEAAIETLKRLSALRAANPTLNLSVGMTLTSQNIRQLGARAVNPA